jgi:hypothetical protein
MNKMQQKIPKTLGNLLRLRQHHSLELGATTRRRHRPVDQGRVRLQQAGLKIELFMSQIFLAIFGTKKRILYITNFLAIKNRILYITNFLAIKNRILYITNFLAIKKRILYITNFLAIKNRILYAANIFFAIF